MAFAIAEKEDRGLLYIKLCDQRNHDYDIFGCFFKYKEQIKVYYYFTKNSNGTFELCEGNFQDLVHLPNIEWYLIKKLKPCDVKNRRIPIDVDEEKTNELYRRFQIFIALNFDGPKSSSDHNPIIELEKRFREKMADRFYRGEVVVTEHKILPRPDTPKIDSVRKLYDYIYEIRDLAKDKTIGPIDLNLLVDSINQMTEGRLPKIELIPGYFDLECSLRIRPLKHSIKVILKSGKKVDCDETDVFQKLTYDELLECFQYIELKSNELHQMTDIKKIIVGEILERERRKDGIGNIS